MPARVELNKRRARRMIFRRPRTVRFDKRKTHIAENFDGTGVRIGGDRG